jgi:predicted carbohydrate-binding protein with CBM5 and CBM33 domain
MMGGRTPETCSAVNKRQDNKLKNCCIWLVIYLKSSVLLVSNMGKRYSLVQNHGYAENKINHVFTRTIYLLSMLCNLKLPNPIPTQKIIFQKVTQ